MVRGMEFDTPDCANINRILSKVLSLRELSQAKVQISQQEIILNNDDYRITSEHPAEVAECVERFDPYIIFLNLQVLPCQAKAVEICSYEDFLNSRDLLVFLIVDVYYVEIYAKDEKLRSDIAEIIRSCGCEFAWKTDENDGRTGFRIY